MQQSTTVISIVISSVLFVVMILFNVLANTLPINNQMTGSVSDNYPNLFQPTGSTFSIWGLIYVLLGIFVFTQIMLVIEQSSLLTSRSLFNIHVLFSLSSLFNIAWLFAWHYDLIGLSTVIMLFLLVSLILLYRQLGDSPLLTQASFKVYLGWISVATIANITIFLVKLGVSPQQNLLEIMTSAILIIGLMIASYMVFYHKDFFFGFVFIWAYFGIYMRHLSTNELNQGYPIIMYTALLSIGYLLIINAFIILQNIRN
jgi:hypothetical protein